MSFKWDGDAYLKKTEAELRGNLEKACIFVKEQVIRNINRSQPYTISKGPTGIWYHGDMPSAPGEFPKKVRGDLQRSLAHEVEGGVGRVGTNLPYGKYLELGTSKMAPRPYLRRTLDENGNTVATIILTGKR